MAGEQLAGRKRVMDGPAKMHNGKERTPTSTGIAVLLALLLAACLLPAQSARLDVTTFVVVGEGLAAGMTDFRLAQPMQENSFPALLARQMRTMMPQPLIQPPGIGNAPGFPALPVSIPGPFQSTVRTQSPPGLFVFNLAVPGHRLTDALNLRPAAPLVQAEDAKQTVTNMILGFPALILGRSKPVWTQVEYAAAMNPTVALVELGYTEALEAAVNGDPSGMPAPAAFGADYVRVLSALRWNYAEIIVTTIPDPLVTAYFSDVNAAAAITGVPADQIESRYGLAAGDLLTPAALSAIGMHADALPAKSVIGAAVAADLQARVRALNTEIAARAQAAHAVVYDLYTLFARVQALGIAAGGHTLTAGYLGGFYSLDGYYPGATGHALIANDILSLLNRTYQTNFSLVDVAQVAAGDPVIRLRATGFGQGARVRVPRRLTNE